MERTRTFAQPFERVWQVTSQVMGRKQAKATLIDENAGLMQFVAGPGTYITLFLEPVGKDRTRVVISRNRYARLPIDETVILDEIASSIGVAAVN